MKHAFWIILFAIIASELHAQQVDSTSVKDSLKIYRDIERVARKRPFTYLLYKSIFNLPKPDVKKVQQTKVPNYDKYKGRIIRNIYITTYDPFGYNVRDTSRKPRSILEKGGNWLHIKSFPITIKNQILFKRGEAYDPLVIKESERILRQSTHVSDVNITPIPIKGNKDSIDIYIREQDVWSIEVGAAWSPSSWTIDIGENNFVGTSHQIKESIKQRSDGSYLHQGSYTIPYIRNTFITGTGFYYKDPLVEQHGITFNRNFFSPLTRWMGGLTLAQTSEDDSLRAQPEDVAVAQRVRYGVYDFWSGYSMPIVRYGQSEEERGTNLILTGRNLNVRYMLKPAAIPDSVWNFKNTQYYLVGLGLSSRTYYRDYYIYRFGIPEDVPAGRQINFIAGQELTNTSLRWYFGLQCGFGKHIPSAGYIGLHGYYGTYIHNGHMEQGVLSWDLGYFTELLSLGNWKVRQFIRLRSTTGYNRKPDETLYITGDQGLRGFNSYEATGTHRLVVNFQTQAYAPFSLIGFHFAPILFFGFAWVGGVNEELLSTTMYQNYGVGLLIKNEYLVFKTFQFTMALYPYIPGRDQAVFKFNPVKTYNFSFSDFAIDKPAVLPFE